MSSALRVVVVGGVAAGPKTASRIVRLCPDADVTLVEKGELLSYAGCGLPYFVSGVVPEEKDLMATPVGVVRDTNFFGKVKGVRVLNRTEAVTIDRAGKRLGVRAVGDGEIRWLDYDRLVLATGATPVVPPFPGIKLPNVHTLHSIPDAVGMRSFLANAPGRDVAIIGGGLIGVEAAEAFVAAGCRVTMVEMQPQILGLLDWEMAYQVEKHLRAHGVDVRTNTRVEAIEGSERVTGLRTNTGTVPADLVVVAVGVRPNVSLAKNAGLDIGPSGAIAVNDRMQTSDSNVYAAGDCVECRHLVTGAPCHVPLGSTANKQGRVVATNVCGGDDTFPGVLGSTVCKAFDFCVGRTGLTEAAARAAGYAVVTVLSPAADKAHYMPEAKTLMLKLVVDAGTRRVLGVQAVGPGDGSKRIDVGAMAITAGMTVDHLAKADLCYAPPYSPAMDNLITAADIARNKLDGLAAGITPMELRRRLDAGEAVYLLDVRSPGEFAEVRLPGSINVPLGKLRDSFASIPRDTPIVTFCKVSLRGYEASRILQGAGFEGVEVLDGGVVMWPYALETAG